MFCFVLLIVIVMHVAPACGVSLAPFAFLRRRRRRPQLTLQVVENSRFVDVVETRNVCWRQIIIIISLPPLESSLSRSPPQKKNAPPLRVGLQSHTIVWERSRVETESSFFFLRVARGPEISSTLACSHTVAWLGIQMSCVCREATVKTRRGKRLVRTEDDGVDDGEGIPMRIRDAILTFCVGRAEDS